MTDRSTNTRSQTSLNTSVTEDGTSRHLIPQTYAPRRTLVALHVVQALILAVSLTIALDLLHKDMLVPFNFNGDTIYTLSNTTAVIQTGWYWWNPTLSAPFALPLIAFPSNPSLDLFLVWVVSRFTIAPGMVTNVTWLLFFFVCAAVSFYCLRQFRIPPFLSMLLGTLYALLPFAFYRNISHMYLSFYLVPFVSSQALVIAGQQHVTKRFRCAMLVGCSLLGFNYPYNAFFGLLTLAGALFIAVMRGLRRQTIQAAALTMALIGATTLINLSPSLYYWHYSGKPFASYKLLSDVETYGLKLRHLLSPPIGHTFSPFTAWLREEQAAQFPLENENATARLGIVIAVGFLVLLVSLYSPRLLNWQDSDYLVPAALLTILLFLIATVGGVASLYSLLLQSADIRTYNRLIVFIAYYSVFALGWTGTRLLERIGHRRLLNVLFCGIALLGIIDQTQAAHTLTDRYGADSDSARSVSAAVRHIENHICAHCMIYQLPETSFPVDGGLNNMAPYDHGRPHIYSTTLRWSWPAFSLIRKAWQDPLNHLAIADMIQYLLASQFSVIWLDRAGYTSQSASPESRITQAVGPPSFVSADGRFVIFDIRSVHLNTSAAARYDPMHPIGIAWGCGFYPEEMNTEHRYRWSKAESSLELWNHSPSKRTIVLSARFQGGYPEPADLVIKGGGRSVRQPITTLAPEIRFPVELAPNQSLQITFSYRGKRLVVPGDTRQLFFTVLDAATMELPPPLRAM